MLGQGRPMNDRREPSVPPRMLPRTGVMPARRTASSAFSAISGLRARIAFMLRYCCFTSKV
ncbi:hypothetical protein D3C72_2413940 [compost metagenome]